ncbi:host-nuclease inhibitor Gam family protein [Aestuariivirga sp. YIM B02566]|uniref:Host-nuclease inhibitor Gam family protein n=1 Tax=Taklimakanibacter albus TaxID=2800327 RepID=A0ACC5R6N2_9HYPH|nr:host-nuclease inhibitor Gam family protein [Aestuariivirga sp. YIM B02566]MBK1868282.1 host-nuclease inhibitor Gam family protein [Aestuariivirga sp. YIM B02566]
MTKTKSKASNAPVPKDRNEASDFIAEIGSIDLAIVRLDADLKEELAAIKARVEARALPLVTRKSALVKGIQIYCEANRATLTDGKSKTISFAAGKASWRLRPPSVSIGKIWKLDDLVKRLLELRRRKALRHKFEINKEAILANPALIDGIDGVKVKSEGEDFIVEPFTPEGLEAAQ